jgi:hypothetical protein
MLKHVIDVSDFVFFGDVSIKTVLNQFVDLCGAELFVVAN